MINKKSLDVVVFDIKDIGRISLDSYRNSVCLLISDCIEDQRCINALVEKLVPNGCCFFITWGNAADEIHDAIDVSLENHGGNYLDVVTTSHRDESIDDVVWFFFNAALPNDSNSRYFVGIDKETTCAESICELINNRN